MLKLYKAGNSICSQKVVITLHEKNLEWETTNISLFKNEQYSPAYLKLNPKGVVPTLVNGDDIVNESTLICEYLDNLFPEPALIPAKALSRTKMRKWSKAVDEHLFVGTREISFSAMFRQKLKEMTPEQREVRFRNVGDPERRARYTSTYEHGTDSPYVFQAVANFEKLFADMEEILADGRTWLVEDRLSLGDINLMPYVARLDYLQLLDIWISERPHVQSWWQSAQETESFRKAVTEALSDKEYANMKEHGSKIREQIADLRHSYIRDYLS